MTELFGIGKGNHLPKLEALARANPFSKFVVHHQETCELFHDGDCNCNPEVEVDVAKC